ncbi:unnamed protein product [Calypogeia fissa]
MPGNALKLEPWDTNSQKEEGFPQVSGASAGSWGRSGSPVDSTGQTRPTTGLCGLECDDPPSPRNVSPNLRQRFVLANRDKESLLEEIIDLKRALSDQAYHLKLHKVHYSAVQLENRKLEKDVEDLEVSGNLEAPRTGGPSRLRAKLQGLRTRLGDLQATCDLQHDELCLLRRDIRVAHTRECEVERDVYAAEICRLQKVVKRLKALQLKISNENRELRRLKDKAARLKLANQRLESCIIIAHKTLEKANKEVVAFRAKALESSNEAKKTAKKLKDLETHAVKLEALLETERISKRAIEQKIKELAQKKKEWDRKWDADQKKKQAATAADAIKHIKKRKKPETRKDRGAHATASSSDDSSGDSDDDSSRGTASTSKKTKKEEFQARKRETLLKLEQRKNLILKKVREVSHAFVTQEQTHYDKVISHSGAATSVSQLSLKDQQKQQEIERGLYDAVDGATWAFMDDVEDIHYGSVVPQPKLDGLSEKEIADAKAKHAKEVALALEKRKAERIEKGGGSRPGSPSSATSGTSGTSGFSDDSSSDSDGPSSASGKSYGSSTKADFKFRQDREFGKNGRKMDPEEFGERKDKFLDKTRKISQNFVEKGQAHYGKILKEIESGERTPGTVGWFTSTSSMSTEDKQEEQGFENEFCEGMENAADKFLDLLEDAQYGSAGKVPRLKLQEMKEQEAAKAAKEREERMQAQADIEERARKKAEKEAAEWWTSGKNKIEVMIDKAKLDEDEYSADVKEVKGRLSVEINLKRTGEHPYVGSPRAQDEERARREEAAQAAQEAQEALQAEHERQRRQEAEEREAQRQAAKEEAQRRSQLKAAREQFRGLTAEEDRRQQLEAKLASGIPLTDEEAAELRALHAKRRGTSGLTTREEARLRELEAKIAAGIPLTAEEEAELKALKNRWRGKSGLTAKEEARLKELEAKIAAGIPLTAEEMLELSALKGKFRGKSGLTGKEESRLRELQAKLKSGIPLTADEEAELRDLKGDVIKKSGLTGRETDRLRELEEKLKSGIPLTAQEEAELKMLRSRVIRGSGLTMGQESRLAELEEKIRNGVALTREEEEELRQLRSQVIGTSGMTGGEEERLKELEAKLRGGLPLSAEEEAELRRLQKKLKTQLTSSEDERKRELEAKQAAGIPLSEDEERELHELQAKRWSQWPLSAAEDARRKELEDKVRKGIPLTPEEEEELRALQAKIKGKFPNAELGEVDMSKSEEMRKKGKLPFIDKEMQGFIKENIRGVLGHLENITEVIVQRQEKLKHDGQTLAATSGAAMDVLKATESGSGGSTPRSK